MLENDHSLGKKKYNIVCENIYYDSPELRIIDDILKYADSNRNFNTSYVDSLCDSLEKYDFITPCQYNVLVKIYNAFKKEPFVDFRKYRAQAGELYRKFSETKDVSHIKIYETHILVKLEKDGGCTTLEFNQDGYQSLYFYLQHSKDLAVKS